VLRDEVGVHLAREKGFRLEHLSAKANWPLHDIVITNSVLCMAYKQEAGGGVVYCPIAVQ